MTTVPPKGVGRRGFTGGAAPPGAVAAHLPGLADPALAQAPRQRVEEIVGRPITIYLDRMLTEREVRRARGERILEAADR